MNSTPQEYFQRVFAWRFDCNDVQTSFLLDFAELERIWTQDAAELRSELDADHDIAPPQVAQAELYPGLGQTGGRYDRRPPQLQLIADAHPPAEQRTRLELDTGFADASPEQLAALVGFAFLHRGRPATQQHPGGLSSYDYAAQRELTVARSLTWDFFAACRELPSAPVVWREMWGDAADVLGFLLWARRLGRAGITLSGPQWAAVLGVSEATVWRYLQRLERGGYLIRLRRYKPGLNGRPVALTSNWYAFGPAALASLRQLDAPEAAVKRARLRVKRRHLRALGRRRGVDLLRGYQWPSRAAYAAQVCTGYLAARDRDRERWQLFQEGIAPVDFTTSYRPGFVFELEPGDPLERRLVGGELVEVVDQGDVSVIEVSDAGRPAPAPDAGSVAEVSIDRERRIAGRENRQRHARRSERRGDDRGQRRAGEVGEEVNDAADTRRGRAHDGCVAPPPGPITMSAFFRRCADARSGAVGAVSRRESRGEITISQMDGPPLERAERIKGLAPGARDTGPPRAAAAPPARPATDGGPLEGTKNAKAAVLLAGLDPRLRAAALALAQAAGFEVELSRAEDAV